ncbi:MAG TPA: hypothetical protein VFK05_12350 [Polyangiaceae bacterium]|nr:hypothetical protein [Polyangiaceae bacterium]
MSTRVSFLRLLSVLASLLCGTACDDSLKSVALIEETRVLGARVEVEADPLRGSPYPGEQASARFFLVAPDAEPNFSYALSLCAVHPTNIGFPPCVGAAFASATRIDPDTAELSLDFRVPADTDLKATPHALARGLICPSSRLNLGPEGSPSCASGSGTEVAFEFALGGSADSNQNPSFTADAFSLDGQPWPEAEQLSCTGDSLPQVAAKSLHTLGFTLADSNFEPLEQPTSVDPARETLLLSPFSTEGKLEHGFLALSADTPPEQRRVNFSAPAVEGSEPRLVRFYFVVRDARSGEDFAQRALCVVP